jgi:hexosaminidase
MKGAFRIVKIVALTLFALMALLILILYFYYGHLSGPQKASRDVTPEIQTRQLPDLKLETDSQGHVLNLLPIPKTVSMLEGVYQLPENLSFSIPADLKETAGKHICNLLGSACLYRSGNADLRFSFDGSLKPQGYRLTVYPGYCAVGYSTEEGLYYALVTLKVLKHNYSNRIPCADILDWPDLEVRGLILDVSRDKVPTLATLKQLVQLLADLKYNQLQLYTEGFSFAYPSFKSLWEGKETPLTGDEITSLDAFCRDRYIDLVPNQNSLGHMTAWLATDQFSELAECPEGFMLFGVIRMKGTIDPNDPRSLELVTQMTDDLLPNFTSDYFNVNLDEPFELGQGKSRQLVKKQGIGPVYLDYVKKVHRMVTDRNKRMMMAGDIVLKHPEIIPDIPRDIVMLDWCYEAEYPFENDCEKFKSSGLDFMVLPGTSGWTSIAGRTDNMIGNIRSAATNAVRFGAKGMLLTDWGDMGHWQYLPVSYAGFALGGALSWNCSSKSLPLIHFLDSYIFNDNASVMGEFALDLGRYSRYEEFQMASMTNTMISFLFGLKDKVMVEVFSEKLVNGIADMVREIDPAMTDMLLSRYRNRRAFDFKGLTAFLDEQEVQLGKANLRGQDSALILAEYRNAIRLLRLGAELKDYINFRDTMTVAAEQARLDDMNRLCTEFLENHHGLWLARNKSGGYDRSTKALRDLHNQIISRKELLNRSFLIRKANRFVERVIAAGLVVYFRLAS